MQTCLTVAGSYFCPAPGSKGTRVLVCYSADSSLPLVIKSCNQNCSTSRELEQILKKIRQIADKLTPDASSVPFLDATSSESVLSEAKMLGILSDSSHETIISLQKQESENFKSAAGATSDSVPQHNMPSPVSNLSKLIRPGQVGYFMNRFLLEWKVSDAVCYNASCTNKSVSVDEEGQCFCTCCMSGDEMVAEVRCMAEADWMHLYELSKTGCSSPEKGGKASDQGKLSASRAVASLKSIPVAARRALPVLVSAEGVLLSVPVYITYSRTCSRVCVCVVRFIPYSIIYRRADELVKCRFCRASGSHSAPI